MTKFLAVMLAIVAALSAPATAQDKPSGDELPVAEAAGRITALKTKGGSDSWDEEVEAILLAAFDKDKSGEIDTEDELNAIPCEVWQAMDNSISAGSGKGSNLIATYGFASRGTWGGDSFGIDEKLRNASIVRLKACGIGAGK